MRIAICDKNIYSAVIIEGYVQKISSMYPKITYNVFYSENDLLNTYNIEKSPYDIIYISIEKENSSGIQTGKRIRDVDQKALIIYISSDEKYAIYCFDVNTFNFHVKPILFEDFSRVFHAAYKKAFEINRPFYFSTGGTMISIQTNDIIYFESDKRKVILYTKDKQYEFYSKLSEIYSQLSQYNFTHIHKSYLLNMNYISKICYEKVTLTNGIILPISESRRKIVRSEHMIFLQREITNDISSKTE